MTNRIKPGPGMEPSWKELIESGELQRIIDRGIGHERQKGMADRTPVFGKVPSNWSELTREQKKAWSLEFLRAAKAAANKEDRPQPERDLLGEPSSE
jgi:hypothetical protein